MLVVFLFRKCSLRLIGLVLQLEQIIKEIKMKLNSLDFKIVVSVMFCIVSAWLIPFLGILSASFSTLLCVQEEGLTSKKSGYYRILATLIGGLAAVLLICCYHFIPSKITLFCLLMLAILGTLYVSKSVALPPFLARITVLTLLIVAIMGKGDLLYVANRLLSTIYGAIVAWGVSIVPIKQDKK